MVDMALDPDVRDVGEWIAICEDLPPVQIFGLLGLLADNPGLSPSLARARETETPKNMQAAKRWMKRHFRTVMQYYCGDRSVFEAAEGILDEAEFVKNLSFIIFGILKVKIGVIVAAVYVVLKLKGDKWCDKYAGMTLAGEGPYQGNFPEKSVTAFFEIMYLPPVEEKVENPAAYPLKVPMPVIEVEKEIRGKVKVPTRKQADAIFSSFQGGGVSRCGAVLMGGMMLPPGHHKPTCSVCGLITPVEVSGGAITAAAAFISSAVDEWAETAERKRQEFFDALERGDVHDPATIGFATWTAFALFTATSALSRSGSLLAHLSSPEL